MAKATIRNGSGGSAVKEWQNYLKSQGYDIGKSGADGIFGSATEAATRKYQKDKGLTVDGIVGANTWGSMNTSTTKNTTTNANTTFKPSATTNNYKKTVTQKETEKNNLGTFTYDDYEASDAVKAAWDKLEGLEKPGEFQYGNQQMFDEVFDKIMNGEKFSYDVNGDALYQQYKDQFVNQGQLAMQDTMGQAAAMTGGYGNSYAQSVGQQTYQGYLQQLNNKIPELYKLALDKYNMERQELKDQYGLLSDDRNYQYGMHRNAVDDYYTERGYLTDQARWMSDDDWNKYVTGQDQRFNEFTTAYDIINDDLTRADDNYWKSYGYDYQVARDAVEDNQWQRTFDEGVRQFNLSQKNSSGGSSGSGGLGGGSGNGGYDTHGYSEEQIKNIQQQAGISVDGIWGPDTEAAYQKGIRPQDNVGDDEGEEKSTYSHGYDYLISQGLSAGAAAGLMTQGEWVRRKAQGNTSAYGSSYEDYVELYCQKNKGK